MPNPQIVGQLNATQKRLAEELLDKNGSVTKIESAVSEGGELPPVSEMVPIIHTGVIGCRNVAFYYTHEPVAGENLTATRAKFPNGSRPDRGQPFYCGSCGDRIYTENQLGALRR